MERFYNIKELSQILSIPKQTLYRWASEGSLPHYKVNGYIIRFKESDIRKWMERFRKEEERIEYSLP